MQIPLGDHLNDSLDKSTVSNLPDKREATVAVTNPKGSRVNTQGVNAQGAKIRAAEPLGLSFRIGKVAVARQAASKGEGEGDKDETTLIDT